jgi:hypothetical protein
MRPPHADPCRRSFGARVTSACLAAFACLLAVSVAGATGTEGSDPSFAPGPPIPAGPTPAAAAIADFNGDDKPDVAVVNPGYGNAPGTVRIVLGNGAGGFRLAPGSPVKIGKDARPVASADFNGDGKADLAVGRPGSTDVAILLGNGAGGISPLLSSAVKVDGGPVSVIAADLNGDGKVDLVVPAAARNGHLITILLGDGSGRFAPAYGSPIAIGGGTADVSVAVADFNRDGKPDLVVATSASNDISLRPGDGAGGFGPATTVLAVRGPDSLAVGDFNGDGKPDLAVLVNKGVAILLGEGAGGFRPAPGSPIAASGNAIAIGDFNDDGRPDLAVANADADRVAVLLGNGAGGFRPAAFSPFAALDPKAIAALDFNGDGLADIMALSGIGNAWWPAPRATAILLQSPSTPQAMRGRSLRGRAESVFSTHGRIRMLAGDGNRVAVVVPAKGCERVVVRTVPGRTSRSFKACGNGGVTELALAGGRVAWIEANYGNYAHLSVIAATLAAGRPHAIESEISYGPGLGGEWVGQLLGGGPLLAFNTWLVKCKPPPGFGCDPWDPTLSVSGEQLVRISAGRGVVVRSGPGSYPLRAVGGGRMAVESAGAVTVLAAGGSHVATVRAAEGNPPRATALSRTRLAIERTFTVDLYNPATGARTKSLSLGPAAALELAGLSAKLALLRGPRRLVLVRLRDGKLISLPLSRAAEDGLVDARLTAAGLFYAYNLPRAAAKGRIVFEPAAKLLARFRR